MMNKLLTGVPLEMLKWIPGFIVVSTLVGCATIQPYDIGQAPHKDSISDFIMQWDKLDRTKATQEEYRQLFAQTLKALSRSLEEAERYKSRLEAQ